MKFSLVALDETEYFREDIQRLAGKIYTVYMYNPEESTNCCEITPSYYLVPIERFWLNEVAEEDKEDLLCMSSDEPIYVHCRSIDRIPEVSSEGLRLKYSPVENDFEDEEEALDYYQGNSFLG